MAARNATSLLPICDRVRAGAARFTLVRSVELALIAITLCGRAAHAEGRRHDRGRHDPERVVPSAAPLRPNGTLFENRLEQALDNIGCGCARARRGRDGTSGVYLGNPSSLSY